MFHLFVAFHHGIIRIASALVVVMFSKLGLVRGCRLFFVSVDLLSDQPDRSLLSCLLRGLLSDPVVFVFPSRLYGQPLYTFHRPLARVRNLSEPDPHGHDQQAGSSPNIPKTSPFSYLDSLPIFFSTVRF